MHPVLFKIFSVEARSYYVLWASALLLFLFWTRRRAVKKYDMDDSEAVSVLVWVYVAAILGSMFGSVAEKIPLVISGREPLKIIMRGGLSSGPGLLCAGLAGVYKLRQLDCSIGKFADAASVPFSAMLALGRNGCFLEGCCTGIGANCAVRPWWGVHFPADAVNFYRYPSQISEAIASFAIMLLLLVIEHLAARRMPERRCALLFPVFLILYGFYRLIFDFFRESERYSAFNSGHILAAAAIVLGVLWLRRSFKTLSGYGD
jgi:phosphatidylglycerol:prolipoprotein diacylglycerol transferase